MLTEELAPYPISRFFLERYLQKKNDPTNFPPNFAQDDGSLVKLNKLRLSAPGAR